MQIKVKPAPDRRVLNHQAGFQPIPDDGCTVERDAQIIRRLADGDLVELLTGDSAVAEPAARDGTPPPAAKPKK